MPKIINSSQNTILAEYAEEANTPLKRMKGLLFRKSLGESCALIITPTSSLHTFFMQFPIDIIFLDKENKIIKLSPNVPPFRLVLCPFGAKCAIELPAGVIAKNLLQVNLPLSIT